MRQKNRYVQRPGEETGPGSYEELCGDLGGWRVVTKRDEAQDVVKKGPLTHRALKAPVRPNLSGNDIISKPATKPRPQRPLTVSTQTVTPDTPMRVTLFKNPSN